MDTPVRTFPDKQNRQIELGGNGINIVAEFNRKEIGRFDFDILEDDLESANILTSCIIDPAFQRSGVGIEMMKLAEEWYEDFCIVNHFADEGAAFINYCIKNVFKKDHKVVPDDRF